MFNLLPITYAFPPWLRDRLTQGRRALPWKPWFFGEIDFHYLYRLLMPCIITCMRSNAPHGTSSVHIQRSPTTYNYLYIRDFGSILRVPDIIGAKFLDW